MKEAEVGHIVELSVVPAGFEECHLGSCQLVHLIVDVLSQMGARAGSELEQGTLVWVWRPVFVSVVDYG